MKLLLIFSTLAAVTGIAGAQVRTARPDSTCTKYSDGRTECRVYRFGPDSVMRRFSYRMDSVLENRAALGVEVRSTGNKRDTLGVFVEAVTPKGPAENAGIVEGDRIASINGVDLRTASADADDEFATAIGARRLTREVQKLTPGTRVTLRVYSGGRFRDVQVTTGKASDVMRLSRGAGYRGPGGRMEFFGPDRMMFDPEMPMIRERLEPLMRGDIYPMLRDRLEEMGPMLRERLEEIGPMIRERLRDLPERIELRTQPRIRTIRLTPRTYRVHRGVERDAEPVSPPVIRDFVATAARDARGALTLLSEAGIV